MSLSKRQLDEINDQQQSTLTADLEACPKCKFNFDDRFWETCDLHSVLLAAIEGWGDELWEEK